MSGLYEARTLLASTASTATGTGSQVDDLWQLGGQHAHVAALALVLDVTAAATDAGDTLDVYVQTQLDGTNWADVARFTQVLGNGGAKRFFKKLSRGAAMTEFENATGLGAAAQRDLLGAQWRVRWVITDAGTDDAAFTFSVIVTPM